VGLFPFKKKAINVMKAKVMDLSKKLLIVKIQKKDKKIHKISLSMFDLFALILIVINELKYQFRNN
jgi:acetolactate synthase small subunit